MRELPHTRSCFVCGESNPLGFQLRFHTDEEIVQTECVIRPEHIGFMDTLHGGLTATLLDEIMAWACAVRTGKFAYCAELNVRYLAPVRPGETLRLRGQLEENRRGRIFHVSATALNDAGSPVAAAQGKYLPVKDADLKGMAGDFMGRFEDVWRKTNDGSKPAVP